MHQIGRCLSVYLFVLVASCLVGCEGQQQHEPIRAYTVKKHESIQIAISAGDEMTDPTDRMLAAVVLVEGDGWFFKGLAKVEAFPQDAVEQFDRLLTSLKFEDPSKPTWELGDRWEERDSNSSMRVTNLLLGDLEFSVSKLVRTIPNERKYIVENVNRWRRQIQLGPVSSPQLSNIAHKVQTSDGHDVTVVDMLGKVDSSALPPMAQSGGGRGPSPKNTSPKNASATASSAGAPFTARTPDHWQQQKPGMMQIATYLVKDGQQSAKVSVSVAGGDFVQNVDRWRKQIGLEPVESEEEIAVESLTVSGKEAKLVRITGERESMVVSIVPHDGQDWFFKLMGDRSVVEKESAAFTEFLSTVQLN